jgi:glycosyltransferase involved in cell wall biosynthesis
MKIIICINTAWNLVNFRTGLIRGLMGQGYEVVAVAPHDEYAAKLTDIGCRFVALPMDNKGINPVKDLILLFRFMRLLGRERPDVFLGYTVKPNVYGSLAAHVLGIPVVNNVAGLGAVFMRDTWLTRLVRFLYKIALSRSRHVFFQNNEDLQMFVEHGLVASHKVSRLPGSGINLTAFSYTPSMPLPESPFAFLLVARLLWDKGVGEYVEAARIIHRKYPNIKFQLLGFLDVKNPTAVTSEQMQDWVNEGVVEYLGATEDVKPYLVASDVIVLPSYREGVPRSLLEAAAIGRPIITTDAVGCRDAVDDGVNGFLCNIRDVDDLANKMIRIIELSPSDRIAMGAAGRAKMEQEFDEKIVIDRYLEVVKTITRNKRD